MKRRPTQYLLWLLLDLATTAHCAWTCYTCHVGTALARSTWEVRDFWQSLRRLTLSNTTPPKGV